MTVKEAREHFGLKDTDLVCEQGVANIMRSNQERLKVWSLSKADRKACELEIEACKVLLNIL